MATQFTVTMQQGDGLENRFGLKSVFSESTQIEIKFKTKDNEALLDALGVAFARNFPVTVSISRFKDGEPEDVL